MGTKTQQSATKIIPGGIGGTGPNGSFFEPPTWVDTNKSPGLTSQTKAYTPPGWWVNVITGKYLFTSPNLIWLAITIFVYFVFPYDFKSARSFDDLDWVYKRLAVNFVVVFGVYGFAHSSLYLFGMGERPFNANRIYRFGKVIHNMWYTFLGVVQITVWEAIFMHCYATKRLPYISDEETFSSYWNMAKFCFSFFWVPIFRENHFYFAHRFIHIKAMYKYIHAVHHRNTDIEPFAGLSMHPVEHVYYYSCIGPSLVLLASPFAFMFNALHLVISPAPGHCGWEDFMQSGQFHYIHHRFFECNYGTQGTPLDKIFGTFRDKLKETGTSYEGGSEDKVDVKQAAIHDSKASLASLPDLGFSIYMGLNCGIWMLLWFAVQKQYGVHLWNPHYLAFLTSIGPVIIAQVMSNLTDSTKRSILYPFHKEGWKTMSIHLVLSAILSIAPVYIMIHMLLANPGESFYFWLRN